MEAQEARQKADEEAAKAARRAASRPAPVAPEKRAESLALQRRLAEEFGVSMDSMDSSDGQRADSTRKLSIERAREWTGRHGQRGVDSAVIYPNARHLSMVRGGRMDNRMDRRPGRAVHQRADVSTAVHRVLSEVPDGLSASEIAAKTGASLSRVYAVLNHSPDRGTVAKVGRRFVAAPDVPGASH